MKAEMHDIKFNLDTMLSEELPYTRMFYASQAELTQDVKDLFEFPLKNSNNFPVYTVSEKECNHIDGIFEQAYAMLVDAVQKVFNEPKSTLTKYFDCEFIRNHPYFIDYAKYTFRNKDQAIYGRFDATFNPTTGKIEGIYEFNGDTPVMLFESVHLQNRITETITGDNDPQFNLYYDTTKEHIDDMNLGQCAVVFDSNYIDDTATSETIAQIIGDKTDCLFVDINELDYCMIEKETPWVVGDIYLDTVFVLSPWEEMVENFPYAFQNYETWAPNVKFMEPAWRWFMSHKGIWAYVTHLMQTDVVFNQMWGHLPVLETYLTEDKFVEAGEQFVSKPVIGRLSSNIIIHNPDGTIQSESEGYYPNTERVYQLYKAPGRIEGRNNFILCMWMAPHPTTWGDMAAAVPATLCIREFDADILSLSNERFIPHIIKDV